MNTTSTLTPPRSSLTGPSATASAGRWLLAVGELILVATLSMMLVDQVTGAVIGAFGLFPLMAHPAGIALVMTVDVLVGTVLWLVHRGRSTSAVLAVAGATALGFAAPLVPFGLGVWDAASAVLAGHVLAAVALVVVVSSMPAHFGIAARPLRSVSPSPVRRGVERVARRWPTVLALLLTFGEFLHPGVSPAWVLVLLGAEYLVIGGIRRQFGDRRILALHIAGALAYAALAVAALNVPPVAAGLLIGVGWILHAGWDVALHRADIVTWRWYAEACIVIDLVVGVSAIVAVLSRI
ncbi:hypothetical protein E4V99_04080 [Microbacterium sp. dk485]|uniref:hypothetical protein n=1 Tax=Microbacterium TaxID=33882 RepID=UPI001073AC39|nr:MULTISPECIES: hypothetical protein [Microbacterium]TFV84253.1 hypothetical protein E4V99_04080 [Microbacterium sp. dk485]TXK15934.1 hypothetical protein FVP99_10600 [Microbacterium wangchenii]